MNSFVHVAGWTLIHFVWQGTAIALAAAIALRVARRSSPNLRYLIACAGLAATLVAPGATAVLLLLPASSSVNADAVGLATSTAAPWPQPGFEGAASIPAAFDALRAAGGTMSRSGLRTDQVIRFIVVCWLIGVAVLLGRMAAGWWQVRQLHRLALATPSSSWQTACAQMASRLGLRKVAHVVESAVVEVPTVISWLRPVIILPVAAMASLTPSQVEAILAHELAHIRRYDYVVNVCQTLVETLLFYHPGVWWLSSRIRSEREHCCDEIAVAASGDAIGYAEALAELESWRSASTMLVLAATSGSLLDRVRRILRVPMIDEPRSPSR